MEPTDKPDHSVYEARWLFATPLIFLVFVVVLGFASG